MHWGGYYHARYNRSWDNQIAKRCFTCNDMVISWFHENHDKDDMKIIIVACT